MPGVLRKKTPVSSKGSSTGRVKSNGSRGVVNKAKSNRDLSNDSFYGDGLAINDDTSGKLNQLGGVFVFNNRDENAAFKKFTLGLNYNLTQNLDDEYFAFGETQNSIDQFFLEAQSP